MDRRGRVLVGEDGIRRWAEGETELVFLLSWHGGIADEKIWSALFTTSRRQKEQDQEGWWVDDMPNKPLSLLYTYSLLEPELSPNRQRGRPTRRSYNHSRARFRRGAKGLQSQTKNRITHPVMARLIFALPGWCIADDSIPLCALTPGGLIRPVPVGSTSSNSKGFCTAILCEGSWG